MWQTIRGFFSIENLELIDPIINRIGLGSITTAVGIEAAKIQEIIPQEIIDAWTVADYALALSIVGSILFIVEKLIVIYHRLKNKNSEK